MPIDLWDAVQAKMKGNASGTSRRLKSQQPSLLVGLVFDGEGRAMTPSHATKPGRRYRYYITRPDQLDDAPAWRVVEVLGMGAVEPTPTEPLVLTLPATKVRRGHQLRLIIPGPQVLNIIPATRDEKLVSLIAEAYAARKLLLAAPDQSIASIAASHGRCRTRLGKLAALACLAPDIVIAIVEGRQPASLTARILQDIDLPLAWPDQRALLGFA